ncbi:phage terminase small subunit P27 family, partial [Xanthomonas albilineans]|uniref:phage terminase small subunit P27 family n=2 Tax=Xanthomonas TaxID=338 RepID=UPI001E4D9B7B
GGSPLQGINMAGRKRLPTTVKQIKGTLQKCRTNLGEPKPQGDLTEPPDYMSEGAKSAWRYALECAPPHLLKRLDMSVLEVWACAADLYRKAQTGINKSGLLLKAPNTGVPMQSPYLSIANKQAQIMTKAATEMGFTPASRSRVSLPMETAEDALDPWADIVG